MAFVANFNDQKPFPFHKQNHHESELCWKFPTFKKSLHRNCISVHPWIIVVCWFLREVGEDGEGGEGEGAAEEEEDTTVYTYIPPTAKEWVSQGAEIEIDEESLQENRKRVSTQRKWLSTPEVLWNYYTGFSFHPQKAPLPQCR